MKAGSIVLCYLSMKMNSIRGLSLLIFMVGFISLLAENNFLLNICFGIESCRTYKSHLELIPTDFQSSVHNYTVHISNDYPYYAPTGPIHIVLYVYMEVYNPDYEYDTADKGVLYDATGKLIIASSESAFSSHDMLLLAGDLDFGNKNEVVTQLIVIQSNNTSQRKSHPYIFIFKRNQ